MIEALQVSQAAGFSYSRNRAAVMALFQDSAALAATAAAIPTAMKEAASDQIPSPEAVTGHTGRLPATPGRYRPPSDGNRQSARCLDRPGLSENWP